MIRFFLVGFGAKFFKVGNNHSRGSRLFQISKYLQVKVGNLKILAEDIVIIREIVINIGGCR